MTNVQTSSSRSRPTRAVWCGAHLHRALVAAALTTLFLASTARAAHDDERDTAVVGITVVTSNTVIGTAALTTLIGGSVSLGTDSPESPSHHLRGWSIANVTLGAIGLFTATLVAATLSGDDWILWAPLGVASAADLGLGIAGLLHEPAVPKALTWVPVPQFGVAPDDSLSMQLVFRGAW